MSYRLSYQLSKNFKLEEFRVSKEFPKQLGFCFSDYETFKLQILCEKILQPLRDSVREPIQILSGKRSQELNEVVGGSDNSDHLTCNAADFTMKKFSDFQWLMTTAQHICANYDFRQVIVYPEMKFIHVSINVPEKKNKNNKLLWRPDGNYKSVLNFTDVKKEEI